MLDRRRDTGRLIGLVQASQSISYHAMQEKFQHMNELVLQNPNVETVGGFVGGTNPINTAFIFVSLKPLGERKVRAAQSTVTLIKNLGGGWEEADGERDAAD